jgi:hypothetical protein
MFLLDYKYKEGKRRGLQIHADGAIYKTDSLSV